jgi:hypothetical protein
MRADGTDRERRLAAAKDLGVEYERAIQSHGVSASDAEKIVKATARFPPETRQRPDGGRLPGGLIVPEATDR